MKRYLAITLSLVLILAGCAGKARKEKEKATEVAFKVGVVEVDRGRVMRVLKYTGIVEAWKKANIVPEIAGKIARIYVDEGQRVKKGQLLAELETERIKLQLQQARAALEAAKANLEDAERNYQRAKRLLAQQAISKQQFEKIELAYRAAKAQVQQAEAAVRLAEHALKVSYMRAPFDGVIAEKLKEEGDFVNPTMGGFGGGPGVLVLVNFDRVKVYVQVPSSDIHKIRIGQEAYVYNQSGRTRGRVDFIAQYADPLSKTFKVGIVADNPEGIFKPGTFADVEIVYEKKENVVRVPKQAIVNSKYVFVVEEGRARKRQIEPGLEGQRYVEIVSGLREGEKVVVRGLFGLYDGAPVEVEK